MQTIKKIFRGLSSFGFKILILVFATVAALVLTFNSPKKIEKSLKDSGVYSTFVDSALKEAQKSSKKDNNSDIPIDNPAIKAAANKAFTPELLQQSTESLLNGTYNWLQGKTQLPEYRIDLTQAKKIFASGVGQAAANRLANLPACTTQQMQQLTNDLKDKEIDPFTVACRPPGINVNAEGSKVTNDIAVSKDFIGTPVLTAQNLPKNKQRETVYDQLNKAPKIYKWINASPWLIAVLALLTAGLCILLYDSKRRGLRNIAIGMVDVGVILIAITLLNRWLINKAVRPNGLFGKAIQGSFQQTALKGINSISKSVQQTTIWICAIYLIIAGVILLILRFTRTEEEKKKKVSSGSKDNEARSVQEKPKQPPAGKPAQKPIQG